MHMTIYLIYFIYIAIELYFQIFCIIPQSDHKDFHGHGEIFKVTANIT